MARSAKTVETSFKELEEVVNQLENNEIGLLESFDLYSKGMKLLKNCNDAIDKVEKKIIILNENGEEDE